MTENEPGQNLMHKKGRVRKKKIFNQIREQMEFYFSDANLQKDRFLKQQVTQAVDGFVDVEMFLRFNKIRALTADLDLILKAFSFSTQLEINPELKQVRRKIAYSEPKDSDERTIYVECLPATATIDWVQKVFSRCGKVVYVSLPKFQSTGDLKGFAFVEFDSIESAAKACELNNPPASASEKAGIFPKVNKQEKHLEKQVQVKEGVKGRKRRASESLGEDVKKVKFERRRTVSEGKDDSSYTQEKVEKGQVKVEEAQEKVEEAQEKVEEAQEKVEEVQEKVEEAQEKVEEVREKVEVVKDEQPIKTKSKKRKRNLEGESNGEQACKLKVSEKNLKSGDKEEKIQNLESCLKGEKNQKSGGHAEKEKTKRDRKRSLEEKPDETSTSPKVKGPSEKKIKFNLPDETTEGSEEKVAQAVERIDKKQECTTKKFEKNKLKRKIVDQGDNKEDGCAAKNPKIDVKEKSAETKVEDEETMKKRKRKKNKSKERTKTKEIPELRVLLKMASITDGVSENSEREHEEAERQAERTERGKDSSCGNVNSAKKVGDIKEKIQFTPDVIIKVEMSEPVMRKDLKERVSNLGNIAYIDLKDGDVLGYVRCSDTQTAAAFTQANVSGCKFEMLKGEEEKLYWNKLLVDREKKYGGKSKPKQRGLEKILKKADKHQERKHIVYD